MKLTYADAGVDIDAGNQAIKLIERAVRATLRPEVIGGIGGFGGLFAFDVKRYREPVLIAGTDGVGTKLKVAFLMNRHDTVGIDLVAMCANDILAQGAEPLFFLDYLATGKLVPEKVASIVSGVAEGCLQAGCALIGGETAEMPGFYGPEEYDLAGFIVGVVEKNSIVDGSRIRPGDCLIGLPSSGLHSNGYSLARKALLEVANYSVDTYHADLGRTIGEEMLQPTRIYVKKLLPLLEKYDINGIAHITGGGLLENIPRILPDGTSAVLRKQSWPVLPIFNLIQEIGQIEEKEMLRTFNMGLGMVLVVPAEQVDSLLASLNHQAYLVGEVIAGKKELRYV